MKKRFFAIVLCCFVLLLAACVSRRKAVQRQTVDSIAVVSRTAGVLETHERGWIQVRELVVMEADSTGVLKPVSRIVETLRGNDAEKTVENTSKIDSTAFSSKSEVIIQETKQNPAERTKTGFYIIIILLFAATVTIFVILWNKKFKLWKWRN